MHNKNTSNKTALTTTEYKPFNDNPYFDQYVNLLINLHQALREGDEEAAESLREQMDLPSIHLSRAEIHWVKGLSADLYMLADDENFQPLDRSEYQLIADLKAASDRFDGEAMLHLLRRASFTKPEHRAWFRSRAYEMLGYFSISQTFLAYAADKAPGDPQYKCMLLGKFIGQKDFLNARDLALHYSREPNQFPALRLFIAVALYRSTENLTESLAFPFLQQARDMLEAVPTEEVRSADALMKWMTLGGCCYSLGDIPGAIAADNEAVNLDPSNTNALEWRGRHRLRTDYEGALDDFKAAIKLDTALPYPYLFVIREYLVQANWEAAAILCRKIIALSTNRYVQAQAYEFLAIALYKLQQSFTEVQNAYKAAIQLAPSERRQHNFQDLMVPNIGIISQPQIHLPLLSVEEVEAIEYEDQIASAKSSETSLTQAKKDTPISKVLVGSGLMDYFNFAYQQQVTERLIKDDLRLAA